MDRTSIRELIDAWATDRRRFVALLAGAGLAVHSVPRAARAQDSELMTYFTWAGYEPPEFHADFIAKYGSSPNIALYGDDDEALAKIEAGFIADVIHPLATDVPRWREAGVIQPIDTSRLSNWGSIAPALANAPDGRFDGKQFFAPNDWGITSVVYREDLVAPEDIAENSWSLLLDEKYAGRLSMYASTPVMVQFAASIAGIVDTTNPSDDDLARMRAVWEAQRPLLRQYYIVETDAEQMLASGEIVACPLWPASVNRLNEQGIPARIMSSPREGAMGWISGMVIGVDSNHIDQAYDFIDAWLSPESGKYLIEAYGYAHSNIRSFEIADPDAVRAVGLDPDKDIAAQVESFQPLPTIPGQVQQTYIAIIDEVMAGVN